MRLFRRRGAGRHAASEAHRTQPPAAVPPDPPATPTRTDPHGTVRLGFSDGSAVSLHHDDPRARAFRAIARELGRRD